MIKREKEIEIKIYFIRNQLTHWWTPEIEFGQLWALNLKTLTTSEWALTVAAYGEDAIGFRIVCWIPKTAEKLDSMIHFYC